MKRFPLPDLLKGFAVFLIIPVHILETFINTPGRESLFGKVLLFLGGPVAVPVFMVMGYFVAKSKKSTAQTFFRGVKIFILGLFLNVGLNFHLLWKIYFDGWQFNPLQYILGVDIFYLAGLSIMVMAFLKNVRKGQVLFLVALIFIISISTSEMNKWLMVPETNYLLPFIAGKYSWSYFPLFPWLVYPLIGFLFQKIEPEVMGVIQKNKKLAWTFALVIFILVLIFGKFGVTTTINLTEYYHHTFLFFLWAMGVVVLWVLLLRIVIRRFNRYPIVMFFRWLGKNITVFYVVQWLIIGNIATAIYQTKSLSEYPFWFVGIFLVTAGLTFLIERRQMLRLNFF